jgi:hypothetical protein
MCGVTALWQEHSAEGIAGSAKSFGIEIGREDRHLKLWRDTPLSGWWAGDASCAGSRIDQGPLLYKKP